MRLSNGSQGWMLLPLWLHWPRRKPVLISGSLGWRSRVLQHGPFVLMLVPPPASLPLAGSQC